ncbi:MAG TPA: tetratricopeptide repeat protein [Acetobacteraceae bacterium]|jgi:hypothetical protein
MPYRLSTQFRTDAHGKPLTDSAQPSIEEAGRHYAARNYAEAERICLAIVARQPRHFDALHLLGVLCLEHRRLADAIGYLRQAERERPDEPQLHYHIGNALLALAMFDEAETEFRRSLTRRPTHFDSLNNLGNTLAGAGRHEEAIECYRQALSVRPDAAEALYNVGRSLFALERLEEATETFRGILARHQDVESRRLVDVYSVLCPVLVEQNRYDEALEVFRTVPADVADNPTIEWNESLTRLIVGDFADGWRKYESRFLVPAHDPPRPNAALLDLNDISGKRVLLFHEQGRGDMIQMARYAPLLAQRGAHVSIETYDDLTVLFSQLDAVEHVVGPLEDSPEHDLLTPLLSLPLVFHSELATIPGDVPYLRAPADRRAIWRKRLGETSTPRVGLMWRGAQHIPKRSVPIAALEPVLRQGGCEFHALQNDMPTADRDWLAENRAVRCHAAELADFADTAALIECMDLIISIDTSVAHLAGALGVPVWIMLPFSPDWRWLREREDSPWYPTARLFRQTRRGDWEDVIQRVAADLSLRFPHQPGG